MVKVKISNVMHFVKQSVRLLTEIKAHECSLLFIYSPLRKLYHKAWIDEEYLI